MPGAHPRSIRHHLRGGPPTCTYLSAPPGVGAPAQCTLMQELLDSTLKLKKKIDTKTKKGPPNGFLRALSLLKWINMVNGNPLKEWKSL